MKNVFMRILMVVLFFIPFVALASTLEILQEADEGKVDFLKLAWEYFKYTFLTSIVLAMNHIVAGTFNISLWWADTGKPLVFAFVGGLGIAALDIYATSWDFFVEAVVGQQTDYTDFENLALTGVFLVGFIKGLFKINKTREKVALKKGTKIK